MNPDGPFSDLRIAEFTHTVMGPTAGMLFAELGAEVIRIETPPKGDRTRYLGGSGAGYFSFYNRHKKSVLLNIKTAAGRDAAMKIIGKCDALVENFAPGTMDRLGLGYEDVKRLHPQVIYCSLKGFLPGPYENRVALDEVAQVMSGLAYMTGLPGQPLRAGASIIDVMGGLAGAFAILGALRERDKSGRGQLVQGHFLKVPYTLWDSTWCSRRFRGPRSSQCRSAIVRGQFTEFTKRKRADLSSSASPLMRHGADSAQSLAVVTWPTVRTWRRMPVAARRGRNWMPTSPRCFSR